MSVAVAFAVLGALVGGGAHVLGHLGLQKLLEHPLYYLAQEVGVVQQEPLRHLLDRPTMVFGHLLLLV